MKIALSVAWIALSVLFFRLAWEHWERAAGPIPPFETTRPTFRFSGGGFHIELPVEGTPLDAPFEELEDDLSAYLGSLDEELTTSHQRAAFGLAGAGLAALLGLGLTRRTPGAA